MRLGYSLIVTGLNLSNKFISIYLQARYLLFFAESEPSEYDNNSKETESTDKAAHEHSDDGIHPNKSEEQDKEVFNVMMMALTLLSLCRKFYQDCSSPT